MAITNIKNSKLCAFCKYWYDPTNQHIKVKSPLGGFWEFDQNASSMCLLWGLKKRANASCPKYQPKIPTTK